MRGGGLHMTYALAGGQLACDLQTMLMLLQIVYSLRLQKFGLIVLPWQPATGGVPMQQRKQCGVGDMLVFHRCCLDDNASAGAARAMLLRD